jgi:hypothetical protein
MTMDHNTVLAEYRSTTAQALGVSLVWVVLLVVGFECFTAGVWFVDPGTAALGLASVLVISALFVAGAVLLGRRSRVVLTASEIVQTGGLRQFRWHWTYLTAVQVDRSLWCRRIRLIHNRPRGTPLTVLMAAPALGLFGRDTEFDAKVAQIRRIWQENGGRPESPRRVFSRLWIPAFLMAIAVAFGAYQLVQISPWQPVATAVPNPCSRAFAPGVAALVPQATTTTGDAGMGRECTWSAGTDLKTRSVKIEFGLYTRSGFVDAYKTTDQYLRLYAEVDSSVPDPLQVTIPVKGVGDGAFLVRNRTESDSWTYDRLLARHGNVLLSLTYRPPVPGKPTAADERAMTNLARTIVADIRLS